MRRLIVREHMSVDGVVSPIGDWFDPSAPEDEELAAWNRRQSARSDALVLGRVTYDELAGCWPGTDDEGGVAAYVNGVSKRVVSRTLTDPSWARTTVITEDPLEALADLKRQPGSDITIAGSITLVHAVLGAGLADEVRLFVHPVVQGEGRRLFPDGPVRHLRPLEQHGFPSGVTYLSYDPR